MTVKRGAQAAKNTNPSAGVGSSSWQEGNENGNGENAYMAGHQDTNGLLGLFSITSMTSDNRNLIDVQEVAKLLKEYYKQIASSTTPEAQRKIIPEVDIMSPGISSILPGIVLHRIVNNTIWVQGVLFSNKDLTISSEPIRYAAQGGMMQQMSVPLTPTSYADKYVIENLRKHFGQVAEREGVKQVAIINMVVCDLEMLNHPEAGDPKDRNQRQMNYLAQQWEMAVLVKVTQELPANNIALPSPFKDPKAAYGKDGHAEARVNAIQDRVNKAGYLSAANMEVVASTINNVNNVNSPQTNSKEIARAQAIVSLSGLTFQAYQANLAASGNMRGSDAFQQFMGMNGSVYPQGYRPLHPVITMEHAQAGEMMNYNQGLFPFFYGLYLLMATNSNYVFTEALRKISVGARGNLSDLEPRIDGLLQGLMVPQNRLVLNEKNITDTDVVNQWIRQNVAPHATFRSNIVTNGPDSAINNYLMRLSSNNRTEEIKAMVAVLDAMTGGKFSELLDRNQHSGTGWTLDKPALHRTQMLVVNGLGEIGGKKLNTLEVDEMFLGHIKGKSGQQSVMNYLGIQYGNSQEEAKVRCQRLRQELHQSIFDGAVHINTFAQSCVWDPNLMALIGTAMDSIGTLMVANTTNSFRPNQMVFAPGAGLATMASVGSNNMNNPNAMMAFGSGFAFG